MLAFSLSHFYDVAKKVFAQADIALGIKQCYKHGRQVDIDACKISEQMKQKN